MEKVGVIQYLEGKRQSDVAGGAPKARRSAAGAAVKKQHHCHPRYAGGQWCFAVISCNLSSAVRRLLSSKAVPNH